MAQNDAKTEAYSFSPHRVGIVNFHSHTLQYLTNERRDSLYIFLVHLDAGCNDAVQIRYSLSPPGARSWPENSKKIAPSGTCSIVLVPALSSSPWWKPVFVEMPPLDNTVQYVKVAASIKLKHHVLRIVYLGLIHSIQNDVVGFIGKVSTAAVSAIFEACQTAVRRCGGTAKISPFRR